MKLQKILKFFMLIFIILAIPTLCCSQNDDKEQLPEKDALLILYENEHSIIYLTSLGRGEKSFSNNIKDSVYLLSYSTASYSKKTKLKTGGDGMQLRAIPEGNNRFRLETLTTYSNIYENGEYAGHGHGYFWRFSCYSDNKNCSDAKIWNYFNENRDKFSFEVLIDGAKIYDFVHKKAEFPGGNQAMMKWLNENMQYPESAKENGIQGRVFVNFVVHSDGRINYVKIAKGVHPLLDNEAIRLVKAMPRWRAGEYEGVKVSSYFTLPITFVLK